MHCISINFSALVLIILFPIFYKPFPEKVAQTKTDLKLTQFDFIKAIWKCWLGTISLNISWAETTFFNLMTLFCNIGCPVMLHISRVIWCELNHFKPITRDDKMTGEHLGICEVAVIPRHGMYQNHTTVPFKIQSSTIH